MTTDIVPIGKYKGQPIERLMADEQYAEWLLAQAWFVDRYADLARLLQMGRLTEPQDTPEHNAMIAGLIDQRDCMEALAASVFSLGDDIREYVYGSSMGQIVEPKGGDLAVYFDHWGQLLIEAKPLIGDDYPSVIRQVKAGISSFISSFGGRGWRPVVIARKVQPTNLTVDQVRRQFTLAGVRLVLESEFFASGPDWAKKRAKYLCEKVDIVERDIAEAKAEIDRVEAVGDDDGGWATRDTVGKIKNQIVQLNDRLAALKRAQSLSHA